MPAQTIGLLGHNGLVGSKTLAELYKLQQAGKIKLVVIHRPSSSTDSAPDDVEKRSLDLTAADGPAFDEAVQGLEVVISAVGTFAVADQQALFPAFGRSKSFKVFIPSEFGSAWSEEELEPMTAKFLGQKDVVTDNARKLGIPVTIIRAALFSDMIFNIPVQWNVKANQVYVYGDSQTTPLPFTTTAYLGACMAKLVQQPVETYANKSFSVVEYSHTPAEVGEMLARLHGKEPELVQYDEARLSTELGHEDAFVSFGAGLLRKTGKKTWDYSQEAIAVEGWKSGSVEDEIKKAL